VGNNSLELVREIPSRIVYKEDVKLNKEEHVMTDKEHATATWIVLVLCLLGGWQAIEIIIALISAML
jgi:hypothetical protein